MQTGSGSSRNNDLQNDAKWCQMVGVKMMKGTRMNHFISFWFILHLHSSACLSGIAPVSMSAQGVQPSFPKIPWKPLLFVGTAHTDASRKRWRNLSKRSEAETQHEVFKGQPHMLQKRWKKCLEEEILSVGAWDLGGSAAHLASLIWMLLLVQKIGPAVKARCQDPLPEGPSWECRETGAFCAALSGLSHPVARLSPASLQWRETISRCSFASFCIQGRYSHTI